MGEINWRDNWPSAQEEAQKIDRRILLELYMDGCPHCAKLHAETHSDDKVAETVNADYVPVRLEGRQNMDIAKQFNVTAAPTTLVFSGDGKELHRFSGYRPPEEYLAELGQIV